MDQKGQINFFYEIFDSSLPRLGPGDNASTRKALSMLLSAMPGHPDLSMHDGLRILDLGCGNGAQTVQLALQTESTILAVDNHQPYLDELERRASAAGVSGKIRTRCADMSSLSLQDRSFDLIWAEGSLFVMGFADGLAAFRPALVQEGLFGATELCWFRHDPPDECRKFFTDEYPPMTDSETNLASIKTAGYQLIGHFHLPESAWWDNYYLPLETRIQKMRDWYSADPLKINMIGNIQREIDIYRKYSDYYGYEFYLMKRAV